MRYGGIFFAFRGSLALNSEVWILRLPLLLLSDLAGVLHMKANFNVDEREKELAVLRKPRLKRKRG